jgi:hypothetical protein
MSIASLQLDPPIRRRLSVAPRDFARRDQAVAFYEAGQYLPAIHQILAYVLPTLPTPDLSLAPLCFVQGSARVRVQLESDQDTLVISTALLALGPDAQSTAALRYALTRLSSTGQLYQPRLRGELLSLEFSDQLALLHPLKLLEVLQRLPTEADYNDAWLQQRFGVAAPDREPIAALDEAEFAAALGIWNAHWTALEELQLESRRRRSLRFLDALGAYAANQLRYTLPLHGHLRATLAESAETYTNKDQNPNKRDAALAKCIKDMRQIDSAELRQCLGHANYAINPLQEGTPSLLTSILGTGPRMQSTGELRAAGRYLEAALELIADYLYLLADHSWPEDIDQTLQSGLQLASSKPWREAVDLLWNHANQTVRVHGSHREHERGEAEDAAESTAEVNYGA